MCTVLCRACVLDCVIGWRKLVVVDGWRGHGLMNTQQNVVASQLVRSKIPEKNKIFFRGGIRYTQGAKRPHSRVSFPCTQLKFF